MAESWGPLTHPTTEGKTTGATDGAVTQPDEGGTGSPKHPMNYDATDGRHSIPNHDGWVSVDPKSGCMSDGDWEGISSRFPDGPGPWRQT
jgi:hypothetical protein